MKEEKGYEEKDCMAVSRRDAFICCGIRRLRIKRGYGRESLVKEANENMEKAKSYIGDMDMQMSMNISSEGVAMDMDMGMKGTIEYTAGT